MSGLAEGQPVPANAKMSQRPARWTEKLAFPLGRHIEAPRNEDLATELGGISDSCMLLLSYQPAPIATHFRRLHFHLTGGRRRAPNKTRIRVRLLANKRQILACICCPLFQFIRYGRVAVRASKRLTSIGANSISAADRMGD